MQCVACNTLVPNDSTFCPKCGQRVQASTVAETPADRLRQKVAAAGATAETERELWRGGFSPRAMLGHWLVVAIISIGAGVASVLLPTPMTWMVAGVIVAALWVVVAVYYFYLRLSIDYRVTTQRLIHRRGILSQVTDRTEMIDIDDVRVTQGIVQRMLGVGNVHLLSSDTSDPSLTLYGIDNALQVAQIIDDSRRDERRRRGMYIEQV